MDKSGSRNQGCLIPILVVVALGAMLLCFDYILIATHLTPSFCSRPECEAMRRMLDISAISTVTALTCATLAACNLRGTALGVVAIGAALVSVVTGLLTGIGMWSLPNAVVTVGVTWLLLLLVADQ